MFKKVNNGILPTRGTKYSAFVDVYANEDITIGAGETKLVPLGIAINAKEISNIINTFAQFDSKYGNKEYLNATNEERLHYFISSHYLQLAFRSSNAKKGLIMPTGFGVIDLDYEGEIMLPIHNPIGRSGATDMKGTTHLPSVPFFHITKGDKIGQITLMEHKGYLMGIESGVERGSGGFGSTGND